jgi:hypothetical protein
MDTLRHATQLLQPFMGETRRGTWLALAFHEAHRSLYDAIPLAGAPRDFTVQCVRLLLDRGCLGPRHALSLLLEVVGAEAGDERWPAFQALIAELDRPCGASRVAPVPLSTSQKMKLSARSGRERPMRLTRIPEMRRDLQKIAGCDNPARAIDILFIHGLGGDAWTTWMADPDSIDSFWPGWLAEDLPDAGLWTLGYAASGSKWKEESMPLADRGTQVLDLLSNEGLGERPLAFITHSMGGIVAKQLLRNAESFGVPRFEMIAASTCGIAFIATPHSGANIASFAELAAAIYRTNEHVKELTAHDPRLRELHGWFLNKYLEAHKIVCRTYCERRELRPDLPLLGIRLPKGILVVDATSAEPNIKGERAIPLDEDHISICKPVSRDAQLYKGMLRFLQECLASTARP